MQNHNVGMIRLRATDLSISGRKIFSSRLISNRIFRIYYDKNLIHIFCLKSIFLHFLLSTRSVFPSDTISHHLDTRYRLER